MHMFHKMAPKAKAENNNNILGRKFATFDDLNRFIESFQRENNVQLYKTSCNKLDSKCVQNKYRIIAYCAKKELIYSRIEYKCVRGGKSKITNSKGARQSRTFRQGCPFEMKIGISACGQWLVIKKLDNVHNHENNKDMFEALPQQRRLTPLEEQELGTLLTLRPNKKLLKKLVKDKTGKVLTSKDLCNIKSRTSNVNVSRLNNDQLEQEVEFCKSENNSTVEDLGNIMSTSTNVNVSRLNKDQLEQEVEFRKSENNSTVEDLDNIMSTNTNVNASRLNKGQFEQWVKFLKSVDDSTVEDFGNNVSRSSDVNVSRDKKNQLEQCVEFWKSVDNSTVEVLNQGKDLKGLFFQTQRMKRAFSLYPELLLFDASYKLNDLNLRLYILLIVNGNGEGEVACIFLLANEETNNLTKFLQLFKRYNPQWTEIKAAMTGKDVNLRDAFKAEFPSVSFPSCLFHTLLSFKTNVTVRKMGITNYEKEECLYLLDKLARSSSESEYAIYYDALWSTNCSSVIEYFNDNWHDIRHEWVAGLLVATYGVTTINHLVSLNKKIKEVVKKNSLSQFAKDFVTLLDSSYEFKKLKLCKFLNTSNVCQDQFESDLESFLTPYAFKLMRGSLEQAKLMNAVEEEYNATKDSCICLEFKKFTLPCRHMFLRRILDGLPFFEEHEIPKRYLLKTYRELFELDSSPSIKVEKYEPTSPPMNDIDTAPEILDEEPEKEQLDLVSHSNEHGLNTLSVSEKYIDTPPEILDEEPEKEQLDLVSHSNEHGLNTLSVSEKYIDTPPEILDEEPEKEQLDLVSHSNEHGVTTLSVSEKYILALEEVKKTCFTLTEYGTIDFLDALNELKKLNNIVKNGETASLSFKRTDRLLKVPTESERQLLSAIAHPKLKLIGKPKGVCDRL